jgi:hypothetical protein
MINKLICSLVAAFAVFFYVGTASAQNTGVVTNHAFPIGKGAGVTGYGSLLLGSGQIAVGQTSADPSAITPSGDVTMSAAGVTAIGASKVTNGIFRQSGALSLVGRSANSTGNVADISAVAASSCVFMESASSLACGTIATASITNNAVTNAKLAQAAASTIKANPTGSLANSQDITLDPTFNFSGTTIRCTTGTTSQLGCLKPDGATITVSGGVITASGGSATAITVGTTNVVSGTSGYVLYNNAGTLGNVQAVPVANGGTGDTGTAWTTYTPVLTAVAGTISSYTCSGGSKTIGKTMFWRFKCQITSNGSGSSGLIVTLPANAFTDQGYGGREIGSLGNGLTGHVTASTNSFSFRNFDNTYPTSPGTYVFSGVMEIQ